MISMNLTVGKDWCVVDNPTAAEALGVDEQVHREYQFALLGAVPVHETPSKAKERRDLCAALPAE
jgi:hypothetical protein